MQFNAWMDICEGIWSSPNMSTTKLLNNVRTCFLQIKKLDRSSFIGLLNENEICEDWFAFVEFESVVVLLELAILALIPWKKLRKMLFGCWENISENFQRTSRILVLFS